jgi:hypothetical protein
MDGSLLILFDMLTIRVVFLYKCFISNNQYVLLSFMYLGGGGCIVLLIFDKDKNLILS